MGAAMTKYRTRTKGKPAIEAVEVLKETWRHVVIVGESMYAQKNGKHEQYHDTLAGAEAYLRAHATSRVRGCRKKLTEALRFQREVKDLLGGESN